jgi:hypothetical protein
MGEDMSEIKATITVTIDCAGIEEEAFREGMKDAITRHIIREVLTQGPIFEADPGLEYYFDEVDLVWDEDA